jgi:hypothetical protein
MPTLLCGFTTVFLGSWIVCITGIPGGKPGSPQPLILTHRPLTPLYREHNMHHSLLFLFSSTPLEMLFWFCFHFMHAFATGVFVPMPTFVFFPKWPLVLFFIPCIRSLEGFGFRSHAHFCFLSKVATTPSFFLHLPLIGFSLPQGTSHFCFLFCRTHKFCEPTFVFYNVLLFPLTTNFKKLKISSAPYYPPSSPNPGHIPAVH